MRKSTTMCHPPLHTQKSNVVNLEERRGKNGDFNFLPMWVKINHFFIVDYFRKIVSLHFVLFMFNFNLKRFFFPIDDSMLNKRKLMMQNYNTGNMCMMYITETIKN